MDIRLDMIKVNTWFADRSVPYCTDLKSSLRPLQVGILLLIVSGLRDAFQDCGHLNSNAKRTILSCTQKSFALKITNSAKYFQDCHMVTLWFDCIDVPTLKCWHLRHLNQSHGT